MAWLSSCSKIPAKHQKTSVKQNVSLWTSLYLDSEKKKQQTYQSEEGRENINPLIEKRTLMKIIVGRVRWKFKKFLANQASCCWSLLAWGSCPGQPTPLLHWHTLSWQMLLAGQTTCNNKIQQTSPTGCATIIALGYWTEFLLCPVLQRTQIYTHFKTCQKKNKAIPYSSPFTAIIYFLYLSHLQSTKNYTYPKPPGLDLLRKRLC